MRLQIYGTKANIAILLPRACSVRSPQISIQRLLAALQWRHFE
jgi:hypothetical protein